MSFPTDTKAKVVDDFAFQHADQWRGCVACKESHHESSFCQKCGRCFFVGEMSRPGAGTLSDFDVVKCPCGQVSIWD